MSDLRTPIGLFFAIVGAILIVVSFTMPGPDPDLLTTVNVNLYSGIAMLVFGSVMLWLARRAS
jgi:hypothetical protein